MNSHTSLLNKKIQVQIRLRQTGDTDATRSLNRNLSSRYYIDRISWAKCLRPPAPVMAFANFFADKNCLISRLTS